MQASEDKVNTLIHVAYEAIEEQLLAIINTGHTHRQQSHHTAGSSTTTTTDHH